METLIDVLNRVIPFRDLLEKMIEYAYKRGWAKKYAKFSRYRGFSTLLAHSLNVYYISLKIARILEVDEKYYTLLGIISFFHDVLKEPDESQEALLKYRVLWQKDPEKLRKCMKEIIKELVGNCAENDELIASISEYICKCLLYTGRVTSLSELKECGKTKESVNMKLIKIVELSDAIASISRPSEINSSTIKDDIADILYLEFEYHEVKLIRGVTTQLLHKALEDYYSQYEFEPLAYFPLGTVYIRRRNWKHKTLSHDVGKIRDSLRRTLRNFISHINKIGSKCVGVVTQTPVINEWILQLYPDAIKDFWDAIFEGARDRKKLIIKVLIYLTALYKRFNGAGKRQAIDEIIQKYCGELNKSDIDVLLNIANSSSRSIKERAVEIINGSELGTYGDAHFIDILRRMVEEIARELLRDVKCDESTQSEVDNFVNIILRDLEYPIINKDIKDCFVSQRIKGTDICPICGAPAAKKAIAKFEGKGSQSFTNFLKAGTPIGGDNIIWVCDSCRTEAIFRNLVQDQEFVQYIYILPQISYSQMAASNVINYLHEMVRAEDLKDPSGVAKTVYELLLTNNWDPYSKGISFIINNISERRSKSIRSIITKKYNENGDFKDILDDNDISLDEFIENYIKSSLENILSKLPPSDRDDLEEIIEDIDRQLQKYLTMAYAGNFILIGLQREIGGDEPDAVKVLMQVLIGGFIAYILQCGVLFRTPQSILDPESTIVKGFVEIPKNINARKLLRKIGFKGTIIGGELHEDWVPFDKIDSLLYKLSSVILASNVLKKIKADFGRGTAIEVISRHPGMILERALLAKAKKEHLKELIEYLNIIEGGS